MSRPHVLFGTTLLALGAGCVVAGPADIKLTPLSCSPANAEARPDEASLYAMVIVCAGDAGQPDVLIVTDQDISWPVLREAGGVRSMQDDLLNAMHQFGAGLLYFDPERDMVWAAVDGAGFVGHVISMTGNDRMTLERRRAFVSASASPGRLAKLNSSLSDALDSLSGP
ncbi:hypothetical protein [Paracoccus sp. MKU1]|uniref:hypothetical protein n=1 Tax=Paracoccus sp. MKU1 TaxID=1745182 RepID=UPI0007191CF9|nr:hypothetical protein [Paracoccus sp. MKU1]